MPKKHPATALMSDSATQPYRPLLPAQPIAPTATDGGPFDDVQSSPTLTAANPSTGSVAKNPERTTRQQIAAACTNCQRKKCKCDGEKPCKPCLKHGLDCNYTYELGITRSRALKRKNEALSEDNEQLRFIVQGLRGGTEEEAREILKRIRESHDVDTAVSYINHASLLLPNQDRLSNSAGNKRRQNSSGASSASPVPRRALPLDVLLNPLVDGQPQPVIPPRKFIAYAPPTLPTNGHAASQGETTSSSSVHSERINNYDYKDVPLLRYVVYQTNGQRYGHGNSDFPGLADRLNAVLDNLPFLITRPHSPTFAAVPFPHETRVPVIAVSARPWTAVTDDDEFVTQLITLFFTWEQPWYNYVEMNSFLDDMKSGNQTSSSGSAPDREFCSSALVNAILAMGCLSSRHPSAYVVPHEAITRGRHFLIEAERLIRVERGRPRLTTLQAMWLTMWYRSCSGYKFRSSEFTEPFYNMYDHLGLGEKMPRPWDYDSNAKSRQSFDAKSEIIWGIYCHDATLAIANGNTAYIQRPLIEKTFERDIPQDDTISGSHLWWPYPEPVTPQPALRHECLLAKVYLTDVCHQIFSFLASLHMGSMSDAEYAHKISEALQIYENLVRWRESLPEELGPLGSKIPHIILLWASFDVAVITLFRSLQHGPKNTGDTIFSQPGFKVVSHAQSLMTSMSTLRGKWTLFRHCYAMQTHWVTAFALLFHVRIGEPIADVFTSAIVGLHEVGAKWPVAAWMLQIVSLMAQHFNLKLPRDCIRWLTIDPLMGMDENSSDVMLPVTIPESLQLQYPLKLGNQVGTYLNDVTTVLGALERTRMAE